MTDWRRFHPAAILFEALGALREAALPLIVLVLIGGLDGGALTRALTYLVAGTALAAVLGFVRWNTTLWRVTDTDIRRRAGVLSRQERSVPIARIQSLDAVRGPLQRAFGVATLHVQTAGAGRRAEIVLTAIGHADAQALRGLVGDGAPEARAEAGGTGPVRRLRASELVLGALTAGQAGAVVAVAAAAAQIADELADPDNGRLGTLRRLAPDTAAEWLQLAALALGAFWLIAIAGSVVAFSGFTLSRDGDRLRVRRGLVSVRDSAIPVRRVQAVRIVEGMLRQPLGLAAVRVETLGYGDEPPANQTLFPLVRRREVAGLLAEFLPEHASAFENLRRPPRRALHRYVLPPVAAALVLAAALAVPAGAGLYGLLATVPAALLGALQWHSAGWRLDPDGRAVVRERRLARSTLLFAAGRAQRAVVAQTPLQRRAALAHVALSVGPATGRVRHVEAATAWRMWQAARPAPRA